MIAFLLSINDGDSIDRSIDWSGDSNTSSKTNSSSNENANTSTEESNGSGNASSTATSSEAAAKIFVEAPLPKVNAWKVRYLDAMQCFLRAFRPKLMCCDVYWSNEKNSSTFLNISCNHSHHTTPHRTNISIARRTNSMFDFLRQVYSALFRLFTYSIFNKCDCSLN